MDAATECLTNLVREIESAVRRNENAPLSQGEYFINTLYTDELANAMGDARKILGRENRPGNE